MTVYLSVIPGILLGNNFVSALLPSVPLSCRKRRLNREVHWFRPCKPRSPLPEGVGVELRLKTMQPCYNAF